MRIYCTLFDSHYLPKGLALHESLMRHHRNEWLLYILPMDEIAREALIGLRLAHTLTIEPQWFLHRQDLEEAKQNRTHQEFCWTCASHLCEYVLNLGRREVTYLDSDLFFFNDPAPVFEEIGKRSIAITPHRFIPSKRHLVVNGLYNVGFVHFKNTQTGMACVADWARRCRKWCYNRHEHGLFGDQKYLDYWESYWGQEVAVLNSLVNIGPWALGKYRVTEPEQNYGQFNSKITINARPMLDGQPLIAYHFHEFVKVGGQEGFHWTNYSTSSADGCIYYPYEDAYSRAERTIESLHVPSL